VIGYWITQHPLRDLKLSEINSYLICPFCEKHSVEPKPGKIICPECGSRFEFDDRLECIFADLDSIRLPVTGVVCTACGLVQGDGTKACLHCRIEINTAVH
jgi:hypothetical protein